MDSVLQNSKLIKLREQIQSSQLPQEVAEKLGDELLKIEVALKNGNVDAEIDRAVNYVNFVATLPWGKASTDILDLNRAKQILDKNHYGLEKIKDRILEYLSVLILNNHKGRHPRQPILVFVGLVGSGKTSLAFSIAESLGRQIVRIPFGGLGSALQLRGESRVKPEAEPGLIIRALKRANVSNPVILLDELDRVAEEARTDIMGVLVELLDPEQNSQFLDHYVSFPYDLSQVMFIATANNLSNVATAVLDRLEIIEMPFYSDEQKIVIGRDYLLPESIANAGLDSKGVQISDDTWGLIVRPLGYDGGIRSLRRNIDGLVSKIAKKVVEGNPGPFVINSVNLGEYMHENI